jgi:hypothetical protein
MSQSFTPARGLAATALGLVLLAAAAAGCSSGGGSGDQKSGGGTAAAAPTGIQVPARIGSLEKAAGEDKFGTPDDGVPKSVRKNLHYVGYYKDIHDSSSPNVIVEGGPGLPIPDEASEPDAVKRLLGVWSISTDRDKATKVSSGSAGGTAECAPNGTVPKDTDCGWVNGKVALVMNFTGFTHDEARALVPKILDAMVTS